MLAAIVQLCIFLGLCALLAFLMTRESSARTNQTQTARQSLRPSSRSGKDGVRSRNPNIRLLIDVVSISIGLLGIGLWIPSYTPDIHITLREPADPNHPLVVLFPVTNNSLTAIFDVSWFCAFNGGVAVDGSRIPPFIAAGYLTQRLDRGATTDLACPEPMTSSDVMVADVEIGIAFTPRLIHTQMAACSHFFMDRYHPFIGWHQTLADPKRCDHWANTIFTPQPIKNAQPLPLPMRIP